MKLAKEKKRWWGGALATTGNYSILEWFLSLIIATPMAMVTLILVVLDLVVVGTSS